MEAFEKELNEARAKDDDDVDGEGNDMDEGDLGDDPFARGGDSGVVAEAGGEAWLGSDRDYMYSEVRSLDVRSAR